MSCCHEQTGFTWRCIFISDLLVFLTHVYNSKHAIREEECGARIRDRFRSRSSCSDKGTGKRPRKKNHWN